MNSEGQHATDSDGTPSKGFVRTVGKLLPRRLGPFAIYLLVWHTLHLLIMNLTGALRFSLDWRTFVSIGASYCTVLLLYLLINLVFDRVRVLKVGITLLIPVWQALFACYLYATKSSLDYSVVSDNLKNAGSAESASYVYAPLVNDLGLSILGGHLVVLIAFVAFEIRNKVISGVSQDAPKLPKLLVVAVAYLSLVLTIPMSYDEIANFFHSFYRYSFVELPITDSYEPGSFPFVREGEEAERRASVHRPESDPLPHVFVIFIESFNGQMVEAESPEGQEYTPVFNDLISRGLFVDHFYGCSIQTSRGHFAAFFSLLPLLRGKVFQHYSQVRFHSLAEVLRGAGFDTLFLQAYDSLAFDNTETMLRTNGFDIVRTVEEDIEPEDAPYIWGWGPEDQVFYRHAFEYLDERHAAGETGPTFLAMATVSSHMRFEVPPERRTLYPEPETIRQRHANTIHLADDQLQVFFRELEARDYLSNSVVVITGDHGFPVGDHGFVHNEIGFYEESFRVPFLLIWDGRVEPRRISESAHSQLDIAPTITDLLGVTPARHHFQGHSMLRVGGEEQPVYLIQPYNGTYLQVVRYPYKYIRRLRTGEEFIFDLATDPDEERSILRDFIDSGRIAPFRDDLMDIMLNHHLITNDEVWTD